MVERGRHPRFAIGESSTPLANLLLEELADRYDLPRIRRVLEMGNVAARRVPTSAAASSAASRSSSISPASPSRTIASTTRQLMVAASPHDDIGDTHWYRPDFDHNLVREAEAAGAIYLDETRLDRVAFRRRSRDARRHAARAAGRTSARRSSSTRADLADFSSRALGLDAPPLALAAADAGSVHAFRECRRAGTAAAATAGDALPAGRCGAASRVSGRMDLDAALRQRHHERGRRADR